VRYATPLPLLTVLLCVLLSVPRASAQNEPLTIAAYNLENAFDVFDNPYKEDEGTDVKARWELESIARAIRATDADIIAISEVENEPVLRALVDEFLADQGYEHVTVMPGNDGRGISLGLISRVPIRSVTSYRWQTLTLPGDDRRWRFARDLMHAKLDIAGPDAEPLHLFVVHFKSKRSVEGDENAVAWRTAEATRTRQIVEQLLADDPDALAVVAGDFNANPDDRAMTTLLTPGDDGSRPLADVHADLPADQRITYPSTRYPDTIFDYILVSPAMAERLVPDSPALVTDPQLTRGSDHLPVYASFKLE
jgi:endonuclease/exonuclease/phosphatase family metal-dependent hydrolase